MTADDGTIDIELTPSASGGPGPASSDAADATPVDAPAGHPVVVIDDAVRRWMERYARTDTSRERGGVLLGTVTGEEHEARVTVEAAVEAMGAEERQASITFTHQTWDYINSVKDERYPHLRIVGWFHTHPGYGVFLSSYDLFIHRNFFTLAWQVAYVIDPLQVKRGFFGWRGGEVQPLPGYYVRGAAPVAEPVASLGREPAPARRPLLAWVATGLALLAIASSTWLGLQLRRLDVDYRALTHSHTRLAGDYDALTRRAQSAEQELAALRRRGSPEVRPPVPTADVRVPLGRGGTLWDVSQRYLGDPLRYPELQDYNRIRNTRRIPTGTVVAIPMKKINPGPAAGALPRSSGEAAAPRGTAGPASTAKER